MANAKTTRQVDRSGVASDLLRSVGGDHSWSDVKFAASQSAALAIGQVLKADGSGNMIPITADTDTVAGIMTYPLDVTGATVLEGYILDGDAEVRNLGVVYFDGATAGNKATIDAKLAALGIKVRRSS